MAGTYKLIGSVTVGAGGQSSISFTSIPQTYTDLVLNTSLKGSSFNVVNLKFNGSTAFNYVGKYLEGTGSAASSSGNTLTSYLEQVTVTSGSTNTFSNGSIYIPNYTSSNVKTISSDNVTEENATTAYVDLFAGLWNGTAAITSIELTGATFAQYSTAYLYGIEIPANQITPKATGGDITYDASYIYHTFRQSGTFTPTQSLTADYLVVAGGGGGGNNYAGGGGGGGLIYVSGGSLTAQAYTVTVGSGGAVNFAGSNSVFNSQTAIGGGVGGDNNNAQRGGDGGSGGGGAASNTTAYRAGGSPTASQGYAGGTGTVLGTWGTGGGGGAGGAGGDASSGVGGNAGAGLQYFGTWYSNGGLGNGSSTLGSPGTGGTPAYTLPTPNTGKGGPHERAGASGVVIVRYAK